MNPRFSYAGGKIFTELMGINFGKYFKKLIIFRPHNVYGKDMGNDHVIPEFINRFKKLKNKKKFSIQGTGNEIRSFIHIEDFIDGFDNNDIYELDSFLKNEINEKKITF